MSEDSDNLSLKKFSKGFFSIKNIAKAIVFGLLFMGVSYVAKAVFKEVAPRFKHVVESTIQANQGTISQSDSHAVHEENQKKHWWLSIFGINIGDRQ
jgi:hypothetical protein